MKRSGFYSILYTGLLVISLFLVCSFSNDLQAIEASNPIPPRPKQAKLVYNLSTQFPDFLSSQEQTSLNQKLSLFAKESSNQILILIVDSLGGLEVNDFSTQLFNQWGLGQEGKNNGVLLLVKPTIEEGGRKVYINVGYGLEATIPDLMAKQIIDTVIVPAFKAGEYYAAFDQATDVLMKLAIGEFDEKILPRRASKTNSLIFILLMPFLFMFLVERFLGRTGNTVDISSHGFRRRHSSYYLPLFLGSSYGAYRGSSSSSFGSSSGFSDFGGFGGGFSGGGGAGSSW